MDVPVETLQLFLENSWDDAPADANSLRVQLRNNERSVGSLFSTSGSLGSVSKNSASQAYRGAALGSLTLVQIQNAWRMLINGYDAQKRETDYLYWLSQNQPASPAGQQFIAKYPNYAQDPDQAVYDFLTNILQPCEEYQSDLTLLYLKPTSYAGGLINPPNFIPCW